MSITKSTPDIAQGVSTAEAAPAPPRYWFRFGVLLAIACIATFGLQVFWAHVLITPWYLPVLGTLAALLVLAATVRQPRWWRVAATVGCIALAAMEWLFLTIATVLPGYSGPVIAGSALPEFQAALADGSQFSHADFQQGKPTALVFFQGRWCPFCMTQLQELEEQHQEFERVGARVVAVSIEDVATAQETQRDFPHLTVVSDERRELSNAVDLINKASTPDGGDSAAPTILLVDGQGTVQWLHRPARFIARPSAAELAAKIAQPASGN